MAQIVVAQRMWQRRDTAATWTSKNPVLAAGEIGVELGANPAAPQMFKIGNGVTPWTGLAYGGGSGSGGSVWRDGAGVPANSLGDDGDYYLRNTNGDVYRRTGGVYAVVANIRGDDGSEVEMRVDSGFIQWRLTGDPGWANLLALATIKGDQGDQGDVGPPGPSSTTFPTASFDGGLGDIIIGTFCDLYLPFGFQVNKATLLLDAEGIFEVDVRVTPYATFPPGSLDTICGGNRPRSLGLDRYHDAGLAGWDNVIPSASTVRFVVTACTGVKRANLVLEGERT